MNSLSPVQRRIHQAAFRLFADRGTEQVNILELAQEAGVARGTVYSNIKNMESLFKTIASYLAKEMHERVKSSVDEIPDPAERLANGIRFFIRRAHEEPQWGVFMHRFAMSNSSLREMFISQATLDLLAGLSHGRYSFRQEQLLSVLTLISSSVLGSIFLVIEGRRTWRDAGSDTAEFVLRALGVGSEQAKILATRDLPPLPSPAESY
ncbi:TetR/AcrR family transcriptional regulator [Pseudomonas sp. MAFF 301449]|uniref:TetR/AcrR family transcriptional regulator n=1 Tax=Pseudomonas cyclaminis TaxID=2781239 RepID=A0ABR9SPS9_9PSED|nr:TetR/AcrR family transcriptional regulator [Pseudomonas cyclaminis]MBE8590939.1 TetR/AcrR family transcriptional regulator [Pseudomonas cyclaminis]MBE8598624.1 TetR/AcrR family transcriptional regulator [Pseudomonas cyclaminis]